MTTAKKGMLKVISINNLFVWVCQSLAALVVPPAAITVRIGFSVTIFLIPSFLYHSWTLGQGSLVTI